MTAEPSAPTMAHTPSWRTATNRDDDAGEAFNLH
jgi:hypothetical protein